MKKRSADLRIVVGVVASLLLGGGAGAAAPDAQAVPGASLASSADDLQARDLFRAQRYAEALVIYQKRHAETHHPTYLRNIGRCHQMARQPAPAIEAFRAYLREARDLDAAEQREIEGYIAEMQRLELSAAPPPPTSATSATSATSPAWPTSPSGAPEGTISSAASPTPTATAAPAARGSDTPPVTRRWWFWTAIAVGLAAATTGVLIAATRGPDRLPCPSAAVCP